RPATVARIQLVASRPCMKSIVGQVPDLPFQNSKATAEIGLEGSVLKSISWQVGDLPHGAVRFSGQSFPAGSVWMSLQLHPLQLAVQRFALNPKNLRGAAFVAAG